MKFRNRNRKRRAERQEQARERAVKHAERMGRHVFDQWKLSFQGRTYGDHLLAVGAK